MSAEDASYELARIITQALAVGGIAGFFVMLWAIYAMRK